MTPAASVRRNPRLVGFAALSGDARYGVEDLFEGCPRARAAGRGISVAAEYAALPAALPAGVGRLADYGAWLPYTVFPSLGEGATPLDPVPALAGAHRLDAVLVKREAANPTGSHKDRMTPLAIARAIEIGARGVVCASSGNAAVSLAAYAACAGLACRVVVTPALTDPFRRLLDRAGARLEVVATSLDRWRRMAALVADGWFPVTNYALPAVGSNPFGVQGYRSVAFELWQQAGPLDAVLVPTARGDLIWGIGDGYRALVRAGIMTAPAPRLIAVEPFARLTRVLDGSADVADRFPGRTRQFSTAGETTTDQAARAVRDSRGVAVAIPDTLALAAQATMARAGHDLELCAAAAVAALPVLRAQGTLAAGARVALIATAASGREPADKLPPLVADLDLPMMGTPI